MLTYWKRRVCAEICSNRRLASGGAQRDGELVDGSLPAAAGTGSTDGELVAGLGATGEKREGDDGRSWGLEDGDQGRGWIPEREDGGWISGRARGRRLDLGRSATTAAGSQAEREDGGWISDRA